MGNVIKEKGVHYKQHCLLCERTGEVGLNMTTKMDPAKDQGLPEPGSESENLPFPMANDCSGVSITEIMTTDPVTVTEEDPVEAVVELFKKHHFHIYPVVTADGQLTGLIDQDIILEILLFERVPRSRHTHLAAVRSLCEDAKGIMTPHPVTISSETDLLDAADLMMKHHIDRVCVVDNGKLVGVVSKRDIINEVYRTRGLD